MMPNKTGLCLSRRHAIFLFRARRSSVAADMRSCPSRAELSCSYLGSCMLDL